MKLYEYAVIKGEKLSDKGDRLEAATLIVEPTCVLARDDTQANLLAARSIPEEEIENLDRLTVVVRPF